MVSERIIKTLNVVDILTSYALRIEKLFDFMIVRVLINALIREKTILIRKVLMKQMTLNN